jgi:hypothetical protein
MNAVTHLEKVITGEVSAVTLLEKVIAGETSAVTYTEKVITGEATPITHLQRVIAGVESPVTHLEYIWAGGSPTPTEHEYTGAVPYTFTADGSPLLDYTIYGNMTQASECGDRTKNYFDKENIDLVNLYPNNSTGAVEQSSTTWSIIVPIDSGGEWIFWIEDTTTNRIRIAGYETYPVLNTQATFLDNTGTSITDFKYNAFEAPEGTKYILIMLSSNQYTQSEMRELLETAYVQIEKGVRKTDYEPYGYKIPVISAGQAFDVYIGTEPLRKAIDGSNVADTITYSTQQLIRRVDSSGNALAEPETVTLEVPEISTVDGQNTIDVLTELKPSEVYIKYKGV